MDRLVPRHRRKAGSGPPASALIAWIGTDPYLREAAATASYQRANALPLPSRTRSAHMAVAVCFVLACGTVLGITSTISHGRGTVQNNAVQNNTPTPPPGAGRGSTSAPAGITPMLADHPGAVPPAGSPDDLTYPGDQRGSVGTGGPSGPEQTGGTGTGGQSGDPDAGELSASSCQSPD